MRSLIETPGTAAGVRMPVRRPGVAVAVREADHAAHHVVGGAHLDLDRADRGGRPRPCAPSARPRAARSSGCMSSWWRGLPRVSRSALCIQELQSRWWRRPMSSSSSVVRVGQGSPASRAGRPAPAAGARSIRLVLRLQPARGARRPQRPEVDALGALARSAASASARTGRVRSSRSMISAGGVESRARREQRVLSAGRRPRRRRGRCAARARGRSPSRAAGRRPWRAPPG